ncbi:MAG: hypothetical protein ABIQ93_15865, partial [Saprospiraceae bacterium]
MLSLMCRSTQPSIGTGMPPILYFSEQLDTVMLKDKVLTITTYRDVQSFLEAFRLQLGAQCILYVSGMDTVFQSNFPLDGPGIYGWPNSPLFGQKHAEFVLDWLDFEPTEFSFRVYNDLGLPMTDDPRIVLWLDSLAKNTLFRQRLAKIPEPHRMAYPQQEISELATVDWTAFQQEIDRRLLDNPLGFYLSVVVNEKGQGHADRYDGPDTLKAFLDQWLTTLRFPPLIFREMRDTGNYSLELDGRRSDQLAILRLQQACRKGQLPTLGNGPEDPYSRVPDQPGGLIDAGTMHSPYPLLAVFGRKAHFFLVTPAAFIPAGSLPYDGETPSFEDYDFDGIPELQFQSLPNMNGNTWSSLARWNPESRKMEFAGRFSSFLEADTLNRRWMETYSGSWYMAQHQKLYGWSQHILTPIRMIEVSLRESAMIPNNCCIVALYENPLFEQGIDSLQFVRDTFVPDQNEATYETIFFGPGGRRQ